MINLPSPGGKWTERSSASPPLFAESEAVVASVSDGEERRRDKVQQATFEISEAVHAAQDLENLYQHIHQIVLGLMPAQNFYIALLDTDTEMISFPYYVDERSPKPAPRPNS